MFRNAEIRYIRMLDFPRIQLFLTSVTCLAVLVIVIYKQRKWADTILLIGLLTGIVINGSFIINYTPLVSVEVPDATNIKASDSKLSLLLSNVKISNRKAETFIEVTNQKNPDLILAMEVDK